jgi:hypothetical protein
MMGMSLDGITPSGCTAVPLSRERGQIDRRYIISQQSLRCVNRISMTNIHTVLIHIGLISLAFDTGWIG